MPSLLTRLEGFLETVVEGGFRRLFAARVQPVEVARALERAMAAQRVVGPATVDVPNRYVARVHPGDYAHLATLRASVERDVAAFLDRRAAEQGYRPIGRITVLLEADPRVRRSTIRAQATYDAVAAAEVEPAVEATRRIEVVADTAPSASAVLIVTDEDGREFYVGDRPVQVGRAIDNDLVIRDLRVSRHHLTIEPAPRGWLVRDLQSTNGTYLDGSRIDEATIQSSTELSLGGYHLALRPG